MVETHKMHNNLTPIYRTIIIFVSAKIYCPLRLEASDDLHT